VEHHQHHTPPHVEIVIVTLYATGCRCRHVDYAGQAGLHCHISMVYKNSVTRRLRRHRPRVGRINTGSPLSECRHGLVMVTQRCAAMLPSTVVATMSRLKIGIGCYVSAKVNTPPVKPGQAESVGSVVEWRKRRGRKGRGSKARKRCRRSSVSGVWKVRGCEGISKRWRGRWRCSGRVKKRQVGR